jgi:hypothetical protein
MQLINVDLYNKNFKSIQQFQNEIKQFDKFFKRKRIDLTIE